MTGNFLSLGMGSALLMFAVGMAFRYQEEIYRKKEGAKIWLLTVAMGVAMLFSGGGSVFFLTLQGVLGLVMAGCCLLQLHREKVLRLRRRKLRRKPAYSERKEILRPAVCGKRKWKIPSCEEQPGMPAGSKSRAA